MVLKLMVAIAKKFQSLIGKIKTNITGTALLFIAEFQSLIGKIKTYYRSLEDILEAVFQSLIGKIKTRIS